VVSDAGAGADPGLSTWGCSVWLRRAGQECDRGPTAPITRSGDAGLSRERRLMPHLPCTGGWSGRLTSLTCLADGKWPFRPRPNEISLGIPTGLQRIVAPAIFLFLNDPGDELWMGRKFPTKHGPLSANRVGIQQAIDVGLPDSPDFPVHIPMALECVKLKHQLKKFQDITSRFKT
jgi:hypothetical protein